MESSVVLPANKPRVNDPPRPEEIELEFLLVPEQKPQELGNLTGRII